MEGPAAVGCLGWYLQAASSHPAEMWGLVRHTGDGAGLQSTHQSVLCRAAGRTARVPCTGRVDGT